MFTHGLVPVVLVLALLSASAAHGEPRKAEKSQATCTDQYGDPLPAGVMGRLGTVRLRGHMAVSVALSPDGKRIASAGYGGVVLWDAATGKQLDRLHRELRGRPDNYDEAYQIAFTPDSKMLAGIDVFGVFLLDVRSWKIRWRQSSTEETLALSPDGRLLAVPGRNHTIRLLELATGKLVRTLSGRKERITSLAFSPDGKSLASAVDGVDIWDVATGKHLRRLEGLRWDRMFVNNLVFAAHDRLTAGSWGDYRVWDAGTGKQLRQVTVDRDWAVALAPDGEVLATADRSTVHLWSVATGKCLRSLRGHTRGVSALAFSGDGKKLVSAGWNGTVCLWDATTGQELLPFAGHRGDLHHVAFAPGGDRLASVGDDGRLCLWDARTLRPLRVVADLDHPLWHVAFSLDGTQLLTTGGDGQVRLWDAATGKPLHRFPGARRSRPEHWYPQVMLKGGHPYSADISPDGKVVAAGNAIGELCLWDTRTGQRLRILERESRTPVVAVAFTPDGKRLLSADGEQPLDLHELPSGRRLEPLPTDRMRLFSLIQGDNTVLVYPRGGACLWHLTMRKAIHPFANARFPDGSRFGFHGILNFSPDGRLAASVASDGEIEIWEVASAELVRTIPVDFPHYSMLYFSPDGSRIVSTDHETYTLSVRDATGLWSPKKVAGGDVSRPQLLRFWQELADRDAKRAYRARWQLAAIPAQAVPFLKEHLLPVAPAPPERVARLIADLGDDHYPVRQQAHEALARLGEAAGPALRRALAGQPSPEARKRIQRLLSVLTPRNADRLREARAVAVLEGMGGREARALLRALAEGVPEARLTCEARAALERLSYRSAR